MTTEEKAKAYDEALERAKKLKETCDNTTVVGWYEYIFPELKESEDEKIRKAIISIVAFSPTAMFDKVSVSREDVLAWLEKQGEQKTDKYEGYCEGCNNVKGCVTCVDGDQWAHYSDASTAELPNDDDYGIDGLWHAQHILENTLGTVDGYETDDGMLEHRCAINAVKKLREQKSTKIGEPNPETLDKAIDLYYFTYGNGEGGFDYLSLDNFRDIVKTFVEDYQAKPTWSEDDGAMLSCVLEDIECLQSSTDNDDLIATYADEIEWLRKIKKIMEYSAGELAEELARRNTL